MKIKVKAHRRADGTKVRTHTRRPHHKRGAVSGLKKLRAHFKGQQRKAERTGNKARIRDHRTQVRVLTQDIGSVKREGSYKRPRVKRVKRRRL